MTLLKLLAPLSLALLTGCTALSSEYRRPPLPQEPAWPATASASANPAGVDKWWLAFGDPGLDRLVDEVVARNNDIFAAALRAWRVHLQADLAANALFPKLNGNLATSDRTPLDRNVTPTSSSSSSIGVSYEIDLWGRLASTRDAAVWQAQAQAEDYEAARLATIGTAIDTYFRLAHANQSIASAESSLAYVRQTQQLVRSQVAGGAASDLELREVEQTVETQAARLSSLKQARLVLRNTLTVLLNGVESPVPELPRLPGKKPPAIAAGLPADILARRPDLRAAEARLRATLKGVDATRASFYPTISLTGSLGTSSQQFLSFISNPVATMGAGAVLAFLNLKDMGLTIAVSEAQYEEAVAAFRTTLLNAFAEVANALGARADHAERARRLSNALSAAREVERLTEARYRAGAVTLRVWLDAQERRRAADVALADVRLAQIVNESLLYRALGGSTPKIGRQTAGVMPVSRGQP